MNILISGKHIELGDSLRQHIETAIQSLVSRYFKDKEIMECHVAISKDRHLFLCDLSIHVSRHLVVRTHGQDADAYRSFDLTLEKMQSRMNRYRSRLRDRKRSENDSALFTPASQYVLNTQVEDVPESHVPLIIAEMTSEIPLVSVSEAVMQMELSDQPILMFKNAANDQFNVVYRRPDGNIGWIDPSKICS